MPRGFETYADQQGAVISSGMLANRELFPHDEMQQWIKLVTLHHTVPRLSRRSVDDQTIPGLQPHLERRAARAIGKCSLGQECRLTVSLPGTTEGILEDGRLVLRCPAAQRNTDAEQVPNGTDELRCRAFHNDAPRRLASYVTETVTAFTEALHEVQAARGRLGQRIQEL